MNTALPFSFGQTAPVPASGKVMPGPVDGTTPVQALPHAGSGAKSLPGGEFDVLLLQDQFGGAAMPSAKTNLLSNPQDPATNGDFAFAEMLPAQQQSAPVPGELQITPAQAKSASIVPGSQSGLQPAAATAPAATPAGGALPSDAGGLSVGLPLDADGFDLTLANAANAAAGRGQAAGLAATGTPVPAPTATPLTTGTQVNSPSAAQAADGIDADTGQNTATQFKAPQAGRTDAAQMAALNGRAPLPAQTPAKAPQIQPVQAAQSQAASVKGDAPVMDVLENAGRALLGDRAPIAAIGATKTAKTAFTGQTATPGQSASTPAQSGVVTAQAVAGSAAPQTVTPDAAQMAFDTAAQTAKPAAPGFTPLPAAPEGLPQTVTSQDAMGGIRTDADLSAGRTGNTAGMERAASHAPRFTPQTVNNLAAQISSRFSRGGRVFDIRLDPAELGRVDVRLEMSNDQRVHAILTVERSETLAELQRSARELERALNEAGLELEGEGLEFQLSDGEETPFEDSDESGTMNVYTEADGIGVEELSPEADQQRSTYGFVMARRDRIDLKA